MKKQNIPSIGNVSAQNKRHDRELWRKEKARIGRGGKPNPKRNRTGKLFFVRITAPERMNIGGNQDRAGTTSFLSQIRKHSGKPDVGIHLDFANTLLMFPSGAVLLIAELDRAFGMGTKKNQIKISPPADNVVDEVLQQIGIYERLGISRPVKPQSENVIHWRAATGVLSEGAKGNSIIEGHEGRLADGISKGLYSGIVEAMTNTIHHAYIGPIGGRLKFGIGKRWWMLSQERDGVLTIAICDLGIGISKSLPRSKTYSFESVKKLWKTLRLDNSDKSAILVAIELGKTRTGQKGRGRGLAEIVEAVNLSAKGSVYIASNKGAASFNKTKNSAFNHSRSIRGTLIHWQVPVVEKNESGQASD